MKKLIILLIVLLVACAPIEPPPGECIQRTYNRTPTREYVGDTIWVNHKTDTMWYCGKVTP